MFIQKITLILKKIKIPVKSDVIKSTVMVSSTKLISSLLNLTFMIYSVNLLSKSENGHFQFYMGFIPVILALAEFGLPSAIVKFVSPHTSEILKIGNILKSSLLIKILSLLIMLVMAILAHFFTSESYMIITIIVFGAFFISFISYFESILVAFRDYKALSFWNPANNLLRVVTLVIAGYYSNSPLSYLDILAIFAFSPAFIFIIFFVLFDYRKLSWNATEDFSETTKELTRFNSWTLLAAIFAIISDKLEIFFINKYHPEETIAVYGTALQLFSGFIIIFSTLNSLVYPKMSRIHDNLPEFRSFLVKSVFMGSGMALLLSPGFFLAEPILNILFAGKYTESIPVFKILYPNYLLQIVFAPMGIALFALGQPKILAILALLRLIFGIVLDNLLIPDFGAQGAATAFFLGQIVSWLILTGYFMSFFKNNQN